MEMAGSLFGDKDCLPLTQKFRKVQMECCCEGINKLQDNNSRIFIKHNKIMGKHDQKIHQRMEHLIPTTNTA